MSQKTHFSGILAITPLWKVLGTKVGCFLIKIQENLYLIDTKILQFDLLEAEIISWQPYLKIYEIFAD